MSNSYADAHEKSITDPAAFWGPIADDCFWYKKWDKVLDDSNIPFYRWFTGGVTNSCYNAVDLHVQEGRGDQAAIIYDSPVTDTKKPIPITNSKNRCPCLPAPLRPRASPRETG